MRRLILAFLVVVQLIFVAPAQAEDYPEDVSLIALIANPSLYDGKRVRVLGFLNLEFEGNALYVDKEAFDAAIHNRVRIERPRALSARRARQLSGSYALVEGTFNASHGGSDAMIERIGRLERWPSRQEFIRITASNRKPMWPTFLMGLVVVLLVGALAYWLALRSQ